VALAGGVVKRDEAAGVLMRAAGLKSEGAWGYFRVIVDGLAESGYEIAPSACPTCGRWLATTCAVCGQLEDS
jgi:hypothetical protein